VSHPRLAPCPSTPNCVSSLAEDPGRRIEPFTFAGSVSEAQERLRRAIRGMKRSRIVHDEAGYLRAEFSTPVLRYVDDVDLSIEPGIVHVRSASRSGYSDLGVNRRRVERLRQRFAATG
jgi:uncharacterized protein (DUF1499 family)